LSLDRVRLPNDAEHIVISDYSATLDRLITRLQERDDIANRRLVAYLAMFKKWATPGQVRGVFNVRDIADIAGSDAVDRVRELLVQ
jgi:hypothetical protein